MADTSDLRIRIERPSPRAASGNFFAPKIRKKAAAISTMCHHCNPLNMTTSLDASRLREDVVPTIPNVRALPEP